MELVGDERDQAGPAARGQQSMGSVWQRAQSLWSDSGIVWQRPVADWEPAEAEWERLRSAGKPPGRGRGRKGRAKVRPDRRGPRAAHARRRGIGGAAIVVGVAVVVAVAVLAAAGYLISSRGKQGGAPKPWSSQPVSPYPPAVPAGADLTTTPSLAGRGVVQPLSAVATYGATVVAARS